ncbi:peptidyl-prolyl cis-trans isomerase, putative [Theileria equi strain WA]|uniref:Peptidyl-prolyl cis-trans isomerase, putative n=1 Tax=Theileria equi strain WA TaxID=1537102 RepID=L0AVG3_THEEQ|nr:peptidyl-prolyl cis-trans isomerase, putative [Theileria equi strain WA]AFZ79535.1 peptidyl-prolyl cis-trans isomerase, putative [Theileria equi strain WA]|eukprot:XP_004829201.1 peptidyl-prolyl cis-trans isomerase, putative [Theileria equi strain WA]
MGGSKHRHSKDKLYILPSELALTQGPKVNNRPAELLPLNCCFLTLLPFKNPVCTVEGHIFDHDKIKEYVTLKGTNPVTGEPLTLNDLFSLTFSTNDKDEFQCPLSFKRFTSSSYVVTVKQSGHVYGYSTLKEVAKKESDGLMHDPLTGIPFKNSDIITLQSPHKLELRTISLFKHLSMFSSDDKEAPKQVIRGNSMYNTIVGQFDTLEAKGVEKDPKPVADKPKHSLFTTGNLSTSFTSTAINTAYTSEYRNQTVFEVREPLYALVKKQKLKAYVKLVTSDGDLNLVLHTDRVPLTCDNFLQHCEDGYYNDTIFHRCVPNFMIQGGDPTGTGRGGESAFYTRAKRDNLDEQVPKYFKDEFDNTLYHVGVGVLSMANKGKHTNGSQFFITFNTCEHLDHKHTVFGKTVGGLELLKKWSEMKVDDDERPKNPPKIIKTIVYSNPFTTVQEQEKERKDKEQVPKITQWIFDPVKQKLQSSTNNEIGYLIKKLKR